MADGALRVLFYPSPGAPASNPYVPELVRAIKTGPDDTAPLEVMGFSWRRAFAGRWDVAHLHWPEYLVYARTRLGRARNRLRFAAWLVMLALSRRPVVETVHNLIPHEAPSRVEAFLLQRLRKLLAASVYLVPSRDGLTIDNDLVYIPHARYTLELEKISAPGAAEQTPQTDVLFFGSIRPYKGVGRLVRVFAESFAAGSDHTMTLAGRVADSDRAELDRLSSELPPTALQVIARFLPDDELHALIRRSTLIVLPYPDLYSSGAVILALTLGRPVLVPDTVAMRVLENEVGSDWVMTYRELDGETLSTAVERARSLRGRPDLSLREPSVVAARHHDLYREVVERSRR